MAFRKPQQSYGHTTEVVSPKFVNLPKPGKSWGSIAMADGTRYVARAEVVGMMQAGMSYSLDTEKQDWENGQVTVVTKAVLANGTVAASKAPSDQFKRQPTPEVDAERMYVAGILNNLVGPYVTKHGAIDSGVLIALTNAARQSWAATFGAKTNGE